MGDLLVVDDEQHIRAAMTKLLQNVGYEVRSAHSAESALDEIKALQPAVVILDLVMGGMDGFELMEVVRQRAEWRIIDFIICSARVTREQAESINACNASRTCPNHSRCKSFCAWSLRSLRMPDNKMMQMLAECIPAMMPPPL